MNTQVTDIDIAAIYQAATDYYNGWYTANVEQISRSLHPELAKRAIRLDKTGHEYLHQLDKAQMLEKTKEGGGSDIPTEQQRIEITLLDRYEEIAAVKVVATEYIDYLQLAKHNGQWLIVNALWTDNRSRSTE